MEIPRLELEKGDHGGGTEFLRQLWHKSEKTARWQGGGEDFYSIRSRRNNGRFPFLGHWVSIKIS